MSPRPRKSLENLRYLRKKNSSGPEHEAPKFKRGDAEGTEGVIEGWADPERQDLSPQSAHDLGMQTGSCHPGCVHKEPEAHARHLAVKG